MSTYYHTLRTKLAQSDKTEYLTSPLKWGAGLGAIGTAAGAGVGLHKDMAHMGANVKGLTSSLSEMGRDYQKYKVNPKLEAALFRKKYLDGLDNYFSDMRRSGRKFNPNTLSTLGLDSAKKTIRHYDDAYEGLRRTRFAHADAGAYTQRFKELLKLKNTKKWAGRAGLAGLGLGAGIGLYKALSKESSDQSDESALASPLKWGAGLGAIGAGVGTAEDIRDLSKNNLFKSELKRLSNPTWINGYRRFGTWRELIRNPEFGDYLRHSDDFADIRKLKNVKKWGGRAGLAGLGIGAYLGLHNALKKESSDYEVKFTGEYNHNHLLDGKMKTDLPDMLQKKIIDYRRKKVAGELLPFSFYKGAPLTESDRVRFRSMPGFVGPNSDPTNYSMGMIQARNFSDLKDRVNARLQKDFEGKYDTEDYSRIRFSVDKALNTAQKTYASHNRAFEADIMKRLKKNYGDNWRQVLQTRKAQRAAAQQERIKAVEKARAGNHFVTVSKPEAPYPLEKNAVSQGAKYDYIKEKGHNSVLGTGAQMALGGGVLGMSTGGVTSMIKDLGLGLRGKELESIGGQIKRMGRYGLIGGIGLGGLGLYAQYKQNRNIEDMAGNSDKINKKYRKYQLIEKLRRMQ